VRLRPNRGPEPDFEQLLLHMTLSCIGALILGALLFGIHRYATHALMPMFLVTSIWLTVQARRAAGGKGQVRRFVIAALGVAVFAFWGRAANMYVQEPVCSICRWGVPYDTLADEMKRDGAAGQIVVTDRELGGNLRRFFPDVPMAMADKLTYAPPSFDAAGGMTLVWDDGESPEATLAHFRRLRPNLASAVLDAARKIEAPWRGHLWKPDGYRVSSWRMIVLPPAQ
jgi:hypothetical protein